MDWTSTQDPLHRAWLLVGHDVAQATVPSVRQPNVQGVVVAVTQLPAPLHEAAVVSVPAEQEAEAPQVVVLGVLPLSCQTAVPVEHEEA